MGIRHLLNVLILAHTAIADAVCHMQAMSYRSGHHSTSDDSSRYRTAEEMQEWRARDPVTRFQAFLDEAGWWDPEKEKALRVAVRKQVGVTVCCWTAVTAATPISLLTVRQRMCVQGHVGHVLTIMSSSGLCRSSSAVTSFVFMKQPERRSRVGVV